MSIAALVRSTSKPPKEADEQETLFSRIDAHPDEPFRRAFSTLNGARLPIGLAMKLKRQGMRRSVADIVWPYPKGRWHGVFIELKRKKGGKVSEEQVTELARLTAAGYLCFVAKGADEAWQFMCDYHDGAIT